MALIKTETYNLSPRDNRLKSGQSYIYTPFQLLSQGLDGEDLNFKISNYSSVFKSPSLDDRLIILGLDLKFTISYGEKIWLEIYYDRLLAPVFGIINTGSKWLARLALAGSTDETTLVYPNELEFITKHDIAGKILELNDTILRVQLMRDNALLELDYQNNNGLINSEEDFQALEDRINQDYDDVLTLVNSYQNNFNAFFTGAPTATYRKLFRTYTLLGYTTKNPDLYLEGTTLTPVAQIDVEGSTTGGSEGADAVPQAGEDKSYKLVQAVNSDLLLVDICYQNRFPAKLPVPYHRSVYYYTVDGEDEETVNTRD